MQLDRIRGDARLSVLEIEERDSDDARVLAEPQLHACLAHLLASIRRRPARTSRRGRLGNHVFGTRLQHEVEVGVRLAPDERHGSVDAEDLPFKWKPRRRQRRRPVVCEELRDRNRMSAVEARAVLQGLYLPTLDAARKRVRITEVARMRWSSDARSEERDRCDDGDGCEALAREDFAFRGRLRFRSEVSLAPVSPATRSRVRSPTCLDPPRRLTCHL
jgi:hypothetical protein